MTLGLTTEGFSRDRLADIKTEYDALVTDALGPVNTNADSVIGQMEGIWAEGIENIQEALQDTYDSMYPSTAEGTSLDGAVEFVGLSRIAASATVVTACAYGTEGTVVPVGSIAHSDVTYTSTSDVTISRANALDVTIEVATVANSSSYNVYAGGASSTYVSSAAATKTEICAGLAAAIVSDDLLAVSDGETLRITAADGESPFALTIDAKLTITKRGSPVVFVCDTNGATVCPVGALINIDSPLEGWDELYNLKAGATGRDVETDTQLRARHATGVRATGSATVEAIRSRMLQDVDSVTSIKIYENRTSITSADGIPPHAFESVVVGGLDSAVANQLWLTKPAGIETYGNVSINVTDGGGDLQVVSFSRPVDKYVWMNVNVDSLNTEESLPSSASTAIREAVIAYAAANIGNGTDVILQRFKGPVYEAVPGIADMTITAGLTDTESGTPVYLDSNIVVGKAQNAVFALSRVSVSGI